MIDAKWHQSCRALVNRPLTVVSRVSAHGRSTITPRFSVYWALTRDTGHLPCVKIEIGGADCMGMATTKCVPRTHARMACNVVRALCGAHTRVSVSSISELLLYKNKSPKYSRSVRKVIRMNRRMDLDRRCHLHQRPRRFYHRRLRDPFSDLWALALIVPGVGCPGAFHSTRQNSYMGAYYGIFIALQHNPPHPVCD